MKYTAKQAAKILGLGYSRIRAICQQYEKIGTKVGSQWLLSSADLNRIRKLPKKPGAGKIKNT